MQRIIKVGLTILVIICTLLAVPSTAQAIPPLPSSMYGTAKVNSANVGDGTLVEALINGTVYASGYTQTYQGDSVYSLDIPGDDAGTNAVEGGKEGDTITFRVGGVKAKETGTWHSGTNVILNLSVTSSTPVSTPEKTPTHFPTQTAIIIPPTATNTLIPSPESTQTDTQVPVATNITTTPEAPVLTKMTTSSLILPGETGISTSSPAKTTEAESPREGSISLSGIILIVVLVLTALIGGILALRWKKGSK